MGIPDNLHLFLAAEALGLRALLLKFLHGLKGLELAQAHLQLEPLQQVHLHKVRVSLAAASKAHLSRPVTSRAQASLAAASKAHLSKQVTSRAQASLAVVSKAPLSKRVTNKARASRVQVNKAHLNRLATNEVLGRLRVVKRGLASNQHLFFAADRQRLSRIFSQALKVRHRVDLTQVHRRK